MKTRLLSRPTRALIIFASVCLTACKSEKPLVTTPHETPHAESMATDAFLMLPGDYAQKTSLSDLEARFGKPNVRRVTEPEPHVVLFPDDPTRRACIHFHQAEAFTDLARISVTDSGSLWRGKHGVHVGMTFAKLRELNGKPFSYYGFDEQKCARVHDGWSPAVGDDAALGAFDVGENDHLYFDVELGPRIKTASNLPADESLSSDDPRFPHLGELILVTGIGASSSLDDEWE